MNDKIVKSRPTPTSALDGRKVKSTDEEIALALSPLLLEYPDMEFGNDRLALWCMFLRDIAPDVLANAVLAALKACKFRPTVADIREQAEINKQAPGPRNDVDPKTLPPARTQMFRLSEEEDREERMNRLRITKQPGDRY